MAIFNSFLYVYQRVCHPKTLAAASKFLFLSDCSPACHRKKRTSIPVGMCLWTIIEPTYIYTHISMYIESDVFLPLSLYKYHKIKNTSPTFSTDTWSVCVCRALHPMPPDVPICCWDLVRTLPPTQWLLSHETTLAVSKLKRYDVHGSCAKDPRCSFRVVAQL